MIASVHKYSVLILRKKKSRKPQYMNPHHLFYWVDQVGLFSQLILGFELQTLEMSFEHNQPMTSKYKIFQCN